MLFDDRDYYRDSDDDRYWATDSMHFEQKQYETRRTDRLKLIRGLERRRAAIAFFLALFAVGIVLGVLWA